MSDEKKQPSADEIVDSMAEELGVKDQRSASDTSSDDALANLGGIFDVPRKKKVKKTGESEAAKPEAAQGPAKKEEASKPVAKKEEAPAKAAGEDKPAKKKRSPEVFASGGGDDGEDEAPRAKKARRAEPVDDVDDFEPKAGGSSAPMVVMGLVIVVLLGVIGILAMDKSEGAEDMGLGQKIGLVLKGEYREYKLAEKKRKEEAHQAEQLAKLERYGNLSIMGGPLYASIKLNGETMYAPIGQVDTANLMNNTWREIRLKPGISNFQDLKIKNKITVEISAPGFETKVEELTEGKWQGGSEPGTTANYVLNVSLVPSSLEAKAEFDARMGSDVNNEYYGTITLNSVPSGAKVIFNKKPLMNEKGEELVTPVTFSSAWVKDEKTGKLEEVKVRVDTVLDNGHVIELLFPDNPAMPRYATMLERQQWTCEKLPEAEIKKLPKGHTLQHECAYKYVLNMDFNALQAFINRLVEERKRVEEKNKEVREKMGAPKPEDAPKLPSNLTTP
jgi:hypothetical protein